MFFKIQVVSSAKRKSGFTVTVHDLHFSFHFADLPQTTCVGINRILCNGSCLQEVE